MNNLLQVGTSVVSFKENNDFAMYSVLIYCTILIVWLLVFLLTDNKKNKKVGK